MSGADPLTFLGEEFLTWLWFRIETEGGDFDLPGSRQVGVSFDDYIAFAPRDDDETEQTLKKGLPSRCPEASTALRNGHRLTRAKLIFAEGETMWGVTLDGPTMHLMSIKLPEDDPETEAADRNMERIQAFVSLQEYVAALYRIFLQQRLSADYMSTAGEQQASWMATR